MTSGGKATTTVDSVRAKTAAAALGLQAGDRIVSINGVPMTAGRRSRDTISALEGKPLSVVVAPRRRPASRSGRAAATRIDGRLPPRLHPPRARGSAAAGGRKESARVTGARVARTSSTSLGNLVDGRGAEGHLEPGRHRPGLVRRRQGGHGQLPLGARPDLALDRAAQPAAVPAARRRAHRLRDRRGHPRPRGRRARSTSASRSSGSGSCCCCS